MLLLSKNEKVFCWGGVLLCDVRLVYFKGIFS